MNILTISTLYPNPTDLKHGIFVRTRTMHLVKNHPEIKPTIIAPVPWFFFSSSLLGKFPKLREVPLTRMDNGLEVHHPRYLVIPKLGMFLAPFTLAFCLRRYLKKLTIERKSKGEEYSLIDGHYYFPDGVSILKVAETLKIPFFCTARGSDISSIARNPLAKYMMQKVFNKSHANFAVCEALKNEMVAIGADESNVHVLRNGVDLDLFSWTDETAQKEAKLKKGYNGRLIVAVGNLVELKGHHLTIEALTLMADTSLVIVGSGPEKENLIARAKELKVEDRVTFTGVLPQNKVNEWFMAADCSILASSREGWANVLLESMASGCPVVATKVWGTPEVVRSDDVGRLCQRTSVSIVQNLEDIFKANLSRQAVRAYAETFDWKETSDAQKGFFENVNQ